MFGFSKTADRLLGTITVSAGATSAPFMIPPRYEDLTVGAVPGAGGTAKVQFTLADPEDVAASPGSVNWYDWDDGAVSTATARVLTGSVTAIRAVATAQPATVEVVARFDR